MRGADTDPWSIVTGLSCPLQDDGPGIREPGPVGQTVRNACHGFTPGPDQVFDCGVVLHLKLGNPLE